MIIHNLAKFHYKKYMNIKEFNIISMLLLAMYWNQCKNMVILTFF
jgi:hypothetical protein